MKNFINTLNEKLAGKMASILVILFFLLMAAAVIYIVHLRQNQKELSRKLVNQSGQITQYQKEINSRGEIIYVQQQQIVSIKQAIQSQLITIEELEANNIRLLQAKISIEEQFTNLQEIHANFKDSAQIKIVEVVVEGIPSKEHWLKLPAVFTHNDPWLNFHATITYPYGLVFEPGQLSFISKPTFYLSQRNKYDSKLRNFFSRPVPVVIYQNKNPYASVNYMENVVIKQPVPFYKQNWFWGSLGFLAGFALAN